MAISYTKFIDLCLTRGLSLNDLKKRGVISDFAYRSIISGEPVSLKHIDKICQHLDLPIEQVVEIIPDEPDGKNPE